MMIARPLLLGLLLGVAWSATALGETCAEIESRANAAATRVAVAASQESAVRSLGATAYAGTQSCPQSDRLWYLAARSAELLDTQAGGDPLGIGRDSVAISREALEKAPRSAQVATIIARLRGDEASARQASALSTEYRPARRALAMALSATGDQAGALTLLGSSNATLDRVARSKALLASGKAPAAVAEAKATLKQPLSDPDELALQSALSRDANEALGLALVAAGKRAEAKGALKNAAALGSEAAKKALATP